MAGFPNLFAALGKWINAINMESEEQKQQAVNVQWIGIIGAALFILAGLLFAFALGEAITAAAMWMIAIVIALGLWMIRRKYISLASMMALVSISSLLTYAIVQGNGSYSIGFALYPALAVFSSLLLSRKLQVVYVGIIIASIAFIIYADAYGVFKSHFIARPPYVVFIIYTIIVLGAALISGLMAHSLESAMARIRASQAELLVQKNILDQVGQAVVGCQNDGTIIYWNQAATDLYGWSAQDAVGRKYYDVLPTLVSPDMAESIRVSLLQGIVWSGEILVQRRDNRPVPIIGTLAPLHDARGVMTGWVGIGADLTEHKRAEEALKRYAEQAQQRAEQLATMNEIGRAVSTLQDLESMLEVILEQVQRNLPLDAFYVCLYDAETDLVTFPIFYDSGQRWREPAARLDKYSRIAHVIRTGQPIQESRTPAEVEQALGSDVLLGDRSKAAASILMAPLQVGQHVIGVISAQSYTTGVYTDEHVALLIGVAHQAAIAIENARLYTQAHQRAEQLATMNEIGRAVSTLQDLDNVLEIIYHQVRRIVLVDTFYICLYDPEHEQIAFPLVYDMGDRYTQPTIPLKPDSQIAGVVRTGKPFMLHHTMEEMQTPPDPSLGIGNRQRKSASVLIVPLWRGERVMGVLSAQSYAMNAYTDEHAEILTGIGHQAAIAIENAQLYEQAQQEIVERKRVQAEREQLIGELEAKNAELERFTYTVSHDLKSPLVTIRGFLGLVEKDALAGNLEQLKADMARITNATDKMQRLLNELLELSRIGRMMNPSQAVPFETIAREAVELVHGRIEARGVQVDIASNLPTVYGDRARLVEAVQNLVDNACKFMGDQSNPRIEIGQRGAQADADGKPVLFVRDNGTGIEPQYQERIFGLFNKLDAQSEGTGIGLALVKRIVEVHGGRIWVESEGKGKGATFYFTISANDSDRS